MISEAELIEIEGRAALMEYIAECLFEEFRRWQRGGGDRDWVEDRVEREGLRLAQIHSDVRRLVALARKQAERVAA